MPPRGEPFPLWDLQGYANRPEATCRRLPCCIFQVVGLLREMLLRGTDHSTHLSGGHIFLDLLTLRGVIQPCACVLLLSTLKPETS